MISTRILPPILFVASQNRPDPRRFRGANSNLEVGFDVVLGARNPRHKGRHKRISAKLNEFGDPLARLANQRSRSSNK
jgi:hypothetical protein